jgi:ABC-type glycerol-3-phosphate transport system substrate-binding protein
MKTVAVLMVVALSASACGGGNDTVAPRATPSACALGRTDTPVRLSIEWPGGVDPQTTNAHIEEFDDDDVRIDVTVSPSDAFFGQALSVLGDFPPVLAEVSYAMLPTLVSLGAVRAIDDCLPGSGIDLHEMLPAARANGQVDGTTYGIATTVDTTLLLYDRAAFARAGLDPDVAPRTLDEVIADGRALRDKAGIARPVAWDWPQMALLGLDVASDDAREAAARWAQLATDDLLYRGTETRLPPIGSGEAAIQLVEGGGLWSYASAIEAGQAPDADLAVAPLPGVRVPVSPFGGGVWVISAKATPEQVAAAMRFLAWYQRPEQQAWVQVTADRYPTTTTAQGARELQDYWRKYPLIAEGWKVLNERPLQLDGWERTLGTFSTLFPYLHEVADGRVSFKAQWPRIVDTFARLDAAQRDDPEALLRCLATNIRREGFDVRECV